MTGAFERLGVRRFRAPWGSTHADDGRSERGELKELLEIGYDVCSQSDTAATRSALSKLELVVVQDIS